MPNLTRQAPFLRPVLFLIAGIIVQYYADISPLLPALFIIALSLVACSRIPALYKGYSHRWMFGAGILLLCLASGSVLTRRAWAESEWPVEKEPHTYCVRVLEEPVVKPKTYMCRLEILSADTAVHEFVKGKRIIAYLPIDERSRTVAAGDALQIRLALDKPSPIPDGTFDYPLYLRKQKYAATGFVRPGDWRQVSIPIRWDEVINYKALEVRRSLLRQLRTILPDEQHYAIAAALAFGYKDEIGKELRQKFANIGAGHILAVSGLHFNILFGMIFMLFSFLKFSPRGKLIRLLIVLPLIWGFAFLTGFSPSVNRAACMMTIWIVGDALFFRAFSINTIAASALFMLLYNPLYLFNISFQLSFLAVLSIVSLKPLFSEIFHSKNKLLSYFEGLVYVSVAAQIGVLPLTIYYFHQLPIIFLITNILAIPLATLLLFLIPSTLALTSIFGSKLTLPLKESMDLFIGTIERLDTIPRANLSGIHIDEVQTLLLYLCLIAAGLLWAKKRIIWVYVLLVLSFAFGLMPHI